MVSLWLAGCTSSDNAPAPVSSVNGTSGSGNTSSGMLITPPPKMGTSTAQQTPQIQPVQRPVTQPSQIQPVDQPVQTENGRIVYNRKYGNIPKGSYTGGSTYTVKRGDTLSTTVVASQPVITYSEDSGDQSANKMLPNNKGTATVVTAPTTAPVVSSTVPTASSQNASSSITTWRWPTDGKIIENFATSEGGNKGIDIAGSKGQAIIATADGRVVYAGNALRGYGNLIIIKHNDDYLSAYAHNDTMLVREQQEVKAGQKIATMGSTGTSSTRLHFEIRYKGKSVNPLQYLPQR
ncbi:MAG: murein hydrolase activator NlpD [Enterobacter hormaechei]|nr:murein hydrolase activator NlpD [Enterobacter hormaechei]